MLKQDRTFGVDYLPINTFFGFWVDHFVSTTLINFLRSFLRPYLSKNKEGNKMQAFAVYPRISQGIAMVFVDRPTIIVDEI